jgi:hypothetical protein
MPAEYDYTLTSMMTQHDVESLYVWGGDGRWIAVPPQRDSKSGDDQLYVRTNSKPDGST